MKNFLKMIRTSLNWVKARSIFQKFILICFLLPANAKSQYITVPSQFDAVSAAKHISHGDFLNYCEDTVEWIVQKGKDRWVTSYPDKFVAEKRFNKIMSKGSLRLSSKTNGGYSFLVAVDGRTEPIKTLLFVKCIVNPYTQKIKSIEIQKSDE